MYALIEYNSERKEGWCFKYYFKNHPSREELKKICILHNDIHIDEKGVNETILDILYDGGFNLCIFHDDIFDNKVYEYAIIDVDQMKVDKYSIPEYGFYAHRKYCSYQEINQFIVKRSNIYKNKRK